jgi:hypothetical protein
MPRYKCTDQMPDGMRQLYEEQFGMKTRGAPSPRRTKYGNVRTQFNGETFDSKAQAEDEQMLATQVAAGLIAGYAREVSIPLRGCPGKRRPRMQIDWLVNEPRPHLCSKCGHVDHVLQLVLKDTKGLITPAWETKRRVLEAQLGIRIEVIQH